MIKTKHTCPLCKNQYEKVDVSQMSPKEYFVYFWEDTIGKEAAEKAWEEKERLENVKIKTHLVASDIQGYQSMVDGSWIESRSKHREHLKRHGMVELGNDVPLKQKQVQIEDGKVRKEKIARQVYEKLRYN